MPVQVISATPKRLRILGEEEIEALYGLPDSNHAKNSAKASSLLDTSINPLKTLGIFMWPTTYNHALSRYSSAPVTPPMPNGACL